MANSTQSSIKVFPAEQTADKKIIFIAWIGHNERTALLARHLGADAYFVKWGVRKPYMAPLRYIVQAFLTWPILTREKPDIIIIQLPPIFLAPLVYLHKKLYGSEYILDSHSGSFLSRIGQLTQSWHRFFSHRALLTLVHNDGIYKTVEHWDAPIMRLAYTPGDYPEGNPYTFKGDFNVVFICTYAGDEPVDAVIEAARQSADVQFYITGNYKRAPHHLENAPDNVTFTGYLEYEDFIGLLRGADALMDLTTRENTVLLGGFEAISLEKPLITSNSSTLRDYFNKGTVHVDNTPQGIVDGIQSAKAKLQSLTSEMSSFREELMTEWDEQFDKLSQVINGS